MKGTRKQVVLRQETQLAALRRKLMPLYTAKNKGMTHTTTGILGMSHNKVLGYKLPEQ